MNTNYKQQFGVLAGYLPQDSKHLDKWLRSLKKEVAFVKSHKYEPSVLALEKLIAENGVVRMYVTMMIEQVPTKNKIVRNTDELLRTLTHIIKRAPKFSDASHFPMSALFVYMMYTPAGSVAFGIEAFNSAIRVILQAWCDYLDSAESLDVINKTKDGWLSPAAYKQNKLYEFIIPDEHDKHGGFRSFNAYFHRQIKPKCRPVTDPGNSKVIVSPNDGTVYKIARNVKASDQFWIKSQPFSLINMLANMYVDRFVGGDVFQAFLSGADYHRWRSPVKGKVIEAKIVPGLMFSELLSAGFDKDAGVLSQCYEASVNTRALVFIQADDPKIGLVCVIPIGITEISSITIKVKPGRRVEKGEELGHFSYGGSTLCTVFQKGAIKRFTKKEPAKNAQPPYPEINMVQANAEFAEAN